MSYGYIQYGFIPSAVWRFSNHFQLFRCRNLALNRFFPTFLAGRHVFIFGVVYRCPYVHTPLYVHTPHICSYTPLGVQTHCHMSPILLCICMFLEASACCGGCRAPYMLDTSLTCWTHLPVWGVPPHMSYTPLIGWLPCASVCFGISACDMGNIPLVMGVWGMFPHMLWVLGHHHHGVCICYILSFLGVHYVSCIYHGYDYYSSSYNGVFWTVICLISDHGSYLP